MRRVEFTVPGDVNELSPNRRLHYHARARLVKLWREKAYLSALCAHLPAFSRKVRVDFHIRRGRRLDECNIVGSGALKAIVDALVDARIIDNDTPEYLHRGYLTQDGAKHHQGRECIIVTIEESE